MKEVNTSLLKELCPGEYAFSNSGRVVFLELLEHPDDYFLSEIKFSMARLGKDEEKEVIAQQGCRGVDFRDALRGLSRENRRIITEFAHDRILQEGKIAKVTRAA